MARQLAAVPDEPVEQPKSPLMVNIDDLNLGDIVDVEEVSGVSFAEVAKGVKTQSLPFKAMLALIWVTKRHDDPTFTYEQARRLKMSDISVGDSDDAAPKEEA